MKIESLIFDMDGTLWDSAKNVADSWNVILDKYDDVKFRVTEADIYGVMGMPMDAIADKFFGVFSKERRMALLDECGNYENEYLELHGGKLFDGLEDTLKKLSEGHRLFIVSNCQSGYIEAFLKHYGFGKYFTDILCWGDTKKPKGDTIRILMYKNDIDAARAAYVGDTQGDCDSTYYAGIRFIHAAYGFGTADRMDASINSITELLDIVK